MFGSINSKKYFDRFIPHRINREIDLTRSNDTDGVPNSPGVQNEVEFVNYAKVRCNQENFQKLLRTTLMPLEAKVLNFFPPKSLSLSDFSIQTNDTWPIKLRRKPVIGPPEMILDMPQFDSHICHHVADWSSQNCLATIFEHEVHMWYPDTGCRRATTNTQKRVQNCVKWTNEGVRLAIGLFPNKVGIWCILKNKLIRENYCCLDFCEIFCLQWLDDKMLVTGCSKGFVCFYTSKLQLLKRVLSFYNCSIINIVVSCDKKYIATSSMNKVITVWNVPTMKRHLKIKSKSIIRGLAWHPWKSSLLAFGSADDDAARVVLWNIKTQKTVAREKTTYKNSSIGDLTFNPISGELVVSYFVRTDNSSSSGIISVFANIDTIVEELHIHNGPVLYFLWGTEGRDLASVSADENLCIWKFFGNPSIEPKQAQISKTNLSSLLHSSIR